MQPIGAASAVYVGHSEGLGASTTLVGGPRAVEGALPLQLLVVEPGALSTYPLPASGSLSIGRAEGCDVHLNDPLASRRHARISWPPLQIEDSGSANGTRVGSAPVAAGAPYRLRLGEPISVGGSILLVQPADPERPLVRRPRAFVPPSLFERKEKAVIVDPAMIELYATIDRIAGAPINVLVLGETGVGKELVAEAIHERGADRTGPLVRINCAALSEALLESELFGHERGAFTGAVSSKVGLLETAHRGTVFLDEVGELSLGLQAKLLRAIEAHEILRVGAVRARPIDVRFVSATNRDLSREVQRGGFRADLFFRLNGIGLKVPPLRERPGDIPALAAAFVARAAARMGRPAPPHLTPDAIHRLGAYLWPGNVRELKNAIDRAVLLCSRPVIRALDLSFLESTVAPASSRHERLAETIPPSPWPLAPGGVAAGAQGAIREDRTRSGELDRILGALAACNGNQTRAAKQLGMPRRTFVAKLGFYDVPRPRKPCA
jgi:two-component system response regulator AtoC